MKTTNEIIADVARAAATMLFGKVDVKVVGPCVPAGQPSIRTIHFTVLDATDGIKNHVSCAVAFDLNDPDVDSMVLRIKECVASFRDHLSRFGSAELVAQLEGRANTTEDTDAKHGD
jgi:hypothetical protein